MPISLQKFKDYAEIYQSAQPGTKSQGIVTVNRIDTQSQTIISIPIDTTFSVNTGQSFINPVIAELNQSQSFIPLALQSLVAGAGQNIPANSVWNTPIAGITLSNAQAFSGGKDPVPELNKKGYTVNKINIPSDSVLALILYQAQKICLGMTGLSSAPDTQTFESAVYFLGRYYLETRTKQQSQIDFDITVFDQKLVNQGIEGIEVHKGVMRILTGMLNADRQVTSFMPEVENESS